MKVTQIRNATLVVEYANKKFLVDPFLAEKGTYPPFPNSLRQDEFNPLVELPMALDEIVHGIDAVIVTHLHLDHFDDVAKKVLPKDIKLFTQNEEDATIIMDEGFTNVEVLHEGSQYENIKLVKTKGEHGRGEMVTIAGNVCGVVFTHPSEKTLYVAGDTVWYEEVEKVIIAHNPEVIVINGGDNQFLQGGSLVMCKQDIQHAHIAAPNAKIIVVHMEAVNHWTLSRKELKEFITDNKMENVLVPDDGESYIF